MLEFGQRIVRIPHHPFVTERFRVAAAVAALVDGRLPVAVPRPVAGGPPAMECHAKLPGRRPRPAEAGAALAADLAAALAALHAVPLDDARAAGVVPDFWAGFLDLAERELPPEERDAGMRAAFAIARDRDEGLPSVLVHHDLHPANMLVEGAPPRLVGIIDFADVTTADPHWDFRHLGDLGARFLEAVVAAYEASTGRHLSRARITRLAESRREIDRAKAALLRRHVRIGGCAAAPGCPS